MNLKFIKNFIGAEYTCELTEKLDERLIGRTPIYRVYILDARDSFDPNMFALRVPGSTLGYILINENMEITEVKIEDFALNRFCGNPNPILMQFIGQKLETEDI